MRGKADNQWNRRENDTKDGKTIENTDKPVFSPFYQLQMSPSCGVACMGNSAFTQTNFYDHSHIFCMFIFLILSSQSSSKWEMCMDCEEVDILAKGGGGGIDLLTEGEGEGIIL